MVEDELELDTLGDRKSALFVTLSDTDSTFNFVAALMYSQLFQPAVRQGGRLLRGPPAGSMCGACWDEFANIGQIPNFDKLIATIRSREYRLLLFCSRKPVKDHLQGRGGYHRG